MYYKISILETILINTKILNWNYERQSDIILNIQFIFVLCFIAQRMMILSDMRLFCSFSLSLERFEVVQLKLPF